MTAAQLDDFWEQGFFLWEHCLSPEHVADARTACDKFDMGQEKRRVASIQEGINRAGEIAFTSHLAGLS